MVILDKLLHITYYMTRNLVYKTDLYYFMYTILTPYNIFPYFPRCNEMLSKDDVSLKSGSIFLVRNSNLDEKWWQGYTVDPQTGEHAKEMSRVPSSVR